MKIIGVMGAVIGLFLIIVLLVFIYCCMVISGEIDNERKGKNDK